MTVKPIFDARRARRRLTLLTASSLFLLAGCGGGGGGGGLASVSDPVGGDTGGGGGVGGGEGIGGTGLSSSGIITGTGSIFVNGVRFDVENAGIFVNGAAASEADLALGMVVKVIGTREDDDNGVADRVDYDSLVEGPIESLERNADNSSARLRVLGQVILVERTSTVFEDATFDALAAGDRVEISGYRDEEGRIRATRIDGDDDGEVTVSGIISDLNGSRFFIGGQEIDAATAILDLEDRATLSDGLNVEVDGQLDGDVLVATEVDEREDLRSGLDTEDDVSAEGTISSFISAGDFLVGGLPVDARSAAISTGGLPLDDGLIVEVEGTWDGSVLIAERLTARRGRIELTAPLADIAGSTLSLQFGNGTVSVTTDARTLLDDDRDDIEYLGLSDLAIGDYVEVEATLDGGTLVATRVDRDDDDDEVEIQAPVEAFVEGSSITVLGLTFNVASAEFENAGDDDIPIADFFRNLRLGALVSIKDEEPTDGFAEEVEFEFATSFDGDREFLDDDEERIEPDALPEAVSAYLAANFPNADIAYVEVDDDEIEVYLADGTEVIFDLDGEFVETDFDDDSGDSDDDSDDDDSDDSDDSDDDSDDDDSDDSDDDSDDDDSDDSDDDSDDDDSDDSDDDSDDDDSDDSDDDSDDDDSDDSDDDSDDDDSDDDDGS